jgi:hypothetical protein
MCWQEELSPPHTPQMSVVALELTSRSQPTLLKKNYQNEKEAADNHEKLEIILLGSSAEQQQQQK